MGKLSSAEVTCHWQPLLLLLRGIRLSARAAGIRLLLLQFLLRVPGLTALLTLHLFALGHPAALHVHLQTAVEMEALVTGLTDEALLGRVWGGRSVFLLLLWHRPRFPLLLLFRGLAVFSGCLGCFLRFVLGSRVKPISQLPPLLSIFPGKETCTGEDSWLQGSASIVLCNFSNTLLEETGDNWILRKLRSNIAVSFTSH